MSEAAKEFQRAQKSLKAAQTLLRESLLEDALSRSYYAVLHAAKSMLLSKGVAVSSHEAVKRLFGLHLVKSGEIDLHFADILRWEQDDRLLADYDADFQPENSMVAQRVLDAEIFLVRARTFVDKNCPPQEPA